MIEVTIEGLDELKKRLDTKRFAAASHVAIGRCANELKIEGARVPPEGPWNQPGEYPKRWYQRLFGPKWAHVDGTTGGPGKYPSQQMEKNWYATVQDNWTAKVANKASYAPWVKGTEQAAVHKGHGWTKLEDDASELAKRGVFTKIYAEEVDKVLSGG